MTTPQQSPQQQALQQLIANGLTFADCVAAFAAPADDPYIKEARCLTENREGELEVDARTVVSMGADNGAYVMAWMWVDNEDAGVGGDDDDEEDGDDDDEEDGDASTPQQTDGGSGGSTA